jgi:DNA-binding phage protein
MPHPLAVEHLPDIDPREHALESRSWGEEFALHLVRYEDRYYAWTVRPVDGGDDAYEMPSEEAARRFLDAEFAFRLTGTDWGERVASVSVGDEATGRMLFSADVLDGAEDGIWLATSEERGEENYYTLTGFSDLGQAVAAFAARAEDAADTIERLDIGWPQVAAMYLRYRAAFARGGAARAALGDTIRRSRTHIRAEHAVSRVAATVGISREFLYHVLAGDEWTWGGVLPAAKHAPSPRPPGPPDPAALRPPAAPLTWSAWARFAMEAEDEPEAMAIAEAVLEQMKVAATIGPGTGPFPDGLWTVTADVDLSGVEVNPDDAMTRACYMIRQLGELTWTSREHGREATLSWPPDIWSRRPGADDVLGHPAIRAAVFWVCAGEGERASGRPGGERED